MSLGKLFIAAVLAEGEPAKLIAQGALDHLFKAQETAVFTFVREFVQQYHQLPARETIQLHTGEALPLPKEGARYYLDLLRQRHLELELKRAIKDASQHLLPASKDPEAAFDVLAEAVMEIVARRDQRLIVDFRQAYAALIEAYKAKTIEQDDEGILFGWPTLDAMTGGLVKGDLVSFVGRPQQGKSQQMLFSAYTPWRGGRRVLFVSMEMKPIEIEQRLAALHAGVPMSHLKHGALSSTQLARFKAALLEAQGYEAPLWVVDGNFTATVDEIWALARQLEPDVIFIDGAYLLKHPKERDRYRRVAENADLIKQQLCDLAPTVCSWQFSREAAKKTRKGKSQVGLEDIGYTDAIGQVSSLVLGLFEQETVEAVKHRRVEILKGRSGEVGRFLTHWDWVKMRFDEVVEESVADLQFT